ncbi:uncharacterized protein LOC127813991 isoform X2 [Diospyros lotus]|uniref:uncharacterized protein LOC127813991 isoform X2 n=1 Tax=Diospyros lotus TaxID=55363 RepID=UPI00225367F6|nr:uncharacterized protein LOC127813991 isoform X2 [Diospyros lotus]
MGRKPKGAKLAERAANTVNVDSNAATQAIIRRSGRLKNLSPPGQGQEIERAAEEINLCESEKEDEPHVGESPPASAPSEWSTEEKISYLMQSVEELKSKAANRQFQSDNPVSDLKYKSMYISAQKKIEALTNENYELSKKLDVALGKIEAYVEAKCFCSEMLEKLKDMFFSISTWAKANETARTLLTAHHNVDADGPKPSKRKKRAVGAGGSNPSVKSPRKGRKRPRRNKDN